MSPDLWASLLNEMVPRSCPKDGDRTSVGNFSMIMVSLPLTLKGLAFRTTDKQKTLTVYLPLLLLSSDPES